ncbi:MAG: thioredoxin domain-containing protein [Cyanobacteria bacterium P01_F01_bin.53]
MDSKTTTSIPALRDIDHTQGPLSAVLLLVIYGNYQCPQSAQANATVKKLRKKLGKQLCFVFRHLPICDRYPQSYRTAEAAEAAAVQGRFWEMHEKLFANQDALDDASLVEYASELDLEIGQFLRELGYHTHTDRVQADIDAASEDGVQDAPTFLISVRHKGHKNLEALVHQILTAALDNKNSD